MHTRLAENSGLNLRAFYDLNPCGKKHWTNVLFREGKDPVEGLPTLLNTACLQMNPIDNLANLPPKYIKTLEALPKRLRQRFLEGLYLSDVIGALWKDLDICAARVKTHGKPIKTVVGLDPAVTNKKTSDETGIIIASIDEKREGIVHDDWSLKGSTKTWAQAAVNAYYEFEAAYIVAEVNQGGDLVEDAIHNIDKRVKVKKVHASKGKFARAEPIAQLYELGQVAHEKELPDLEAQMTEWVPHESSESPDRIDGLVWALTDLMMGPSPSQFHIG
jgi:phage terminase large subunit-like protein